MKLFWKQFITMVCSIITAFMIFGNVIIYASFQMTLNRETERSLEEFRIFQYAMLASLAGLPKDYQATDTAVAEIAKSIEKSLENNSNMVVIYNEEEKVIYQNAEYKSSLMQMDWKENSGIWQISEHNGNYWLESLFRLKSSEGEYYLEINRDINYVYEERESLYDNYKTALFCVFSVSALLAFVLSMSVTRSIRRLSGATRDFANGNYKRRVKEKGNDEVAILSQDFNKMAEQLENNIWQLEENARRQEEFTEAFSHELKTPLTSIIGYADMLRSMQLSEEDTILSADYILKQGKRLERLAMKMMELSYVDKQEIERKKISAKELAWKVEKLTKELLKEKKIELVLQVEDGVIYGDEDLLQSLFSNLIDNARKACSDSGVISMTGIHKKEGFLFQIEDNGEGMPEEEIGKITEAFYMIDKSRARKEGGAGMGMALCKKIVELHHACWSIESRLGEGTRIEIQFPSKKIAVHRQKESSMSGQEMKENE